MQLRLGVMVVVGLVAASSSFAGVPADYWQIDETLVEDYYGPGTGTNQVGLTITNQHPTLAINGFALTVEDNCSEVRYPFDGWAGEHRSGSEQWDSPAWTWDAIGGLTMKEYFGMSYAEAFPSADADTHWAFYVSDVRDAVPGTIGAGETVGLNSDVPPDYVFSYITSDEPYSDAVVRLTDGSSFGGPTDQPNAFPTGDDDDDEPVAEPASLLIVGLAALTRRKRR
jgi:hypothetical protein